MSMHVKIGPLELRAEAREGLKVYVVTAKIGDATAAMPPMTPQEWQALVARSAAMATAEVIAKQWRERHIAEPALIDLLAEHIRHG